MIKVKLPMPHYKKRSKALMTMNVYRNAHHRIQAAFKRDYGALCCTAIKDALPSKVFKCVKITYELHKSPTKGSPTKSEPYRGSKPSKLDLSNVLSMVDKAFCDSLKKEGLIPDDEIAFVQSVQFEVNPWATEECIIVTGEEIEPKKDLRLSQSVSSNQEGRMAA